MSEVLESDDEKFWGFFRLQKSAEHFQPTLHYNVSSNMQNMEQNNQTEEAEEEKDFNSKKEKEQAESDVLNISSKSNRKKKPLKLKKKMFKFISKIETNGPKGKKSKKLNKDNIMKAALKAPFRKFVKLIKKYGGIKLKKVNLNKVFGGLKRNKRVIHLKLYQLICYDEKGDNKLKLMKKKPKNEKLFKYLLSREYIFLLRKYNEKNPKFIIDGKDENIQDFPNINEVLKNIYKNKEVKISEVKKMTSNILNNFQGLNERNPNKERGLGLEIKAEYIKDFEGNLKNVIKSDLNIDAEIEKMDESFSNSIRLDISLEEEDKDEMRIKIEPNNNIIFQNLINEQDPFEKFQSTKEDSFSFNFPKLNNLDNSISYYIDDDKKNGDHEENDEIIKFDEMNDSFVFNYNKEFEEIKKSFLPSI
jgi:hypothetical protein